MKALEDEEKKNRKLAQLFEIEAMATKQKVVFDKNLILLV
jgi:hypothetical protein